MDEKTNIGPDDARVLATIAELPLADEREGPIAEQLSEWLTAANELSRKMSAAEHWELNPATAFKHPDTEGAHE